MPKNLKQATKKSIYESKVSKLDGLGTGSGDFSETLTVVESVLGDFIDRVHENINNETGMVTTGAINDITLQAGQGVVNVLAHKHLIYQDRGVNGSEQKLFDTPHAYSDKMPPTSVFKQWIKEKNIKLENNATYYGDESPFKDLREEEQISKAAWGMAKKVFKEGFKPRKIYSKEIPQLVEDLKKEIADFAVQQIIQGIDVKPSAKRITK